jgi:hypothetical protein
LNLSSRPIGHLIKKIIATSDANSFGVSCFLVLLGTLTDMKRVRLATQAELGAERPAILRKDFILDR